MKLIQVLKTKKVTAEADTMIKLLQEKAQKAQKKAKSVPQPACSDLVHLQLKNHEEDCFAEKEVFFGKRLAAAYSGLTASEVFKPAHKNERRNRINRNKLSVQEEELLHQTRIKIRKI